MALIALSGCRIRLFDYRGAQKAAEAARAIALQNDDRETAGAAAVNLATIYLQLNDLRLAGKEAASAADLLQTCGDKPHLPKALLIYANVEAERLRVRVEAERARGEKLAESRDIEQMRSNYLRGVKVAHQRRLWSLEANLWEEMGEALLLAQHPKEAEEPIRKAYAIESAAGDGDALAVNQEHQAELKLQEQKYAEGLQLIDDAFASHSTYFRTTPSYFPLHIRGKLLARLHREPEALRELRKAVHSATEWRQGALPGDATSTRTVVRLDEVYRDFAQLAAAIAIRTNNAALGRESLEALAENRAANLREQITLAAWRNARLPQKYFDLLAELQTVQGRLTLGDKRAADQARLDEIRLGLSGIENDLGDLPEFSHGNERKWTKNSLTNIQARLAENEVLLSFSLGDEASFLWTLTRDEVSVYKLAGEAEVGKAADGFAQAVERGQNPEASGRTLSQLLLGGLPASVWKHSEWLVVGDGVLLNGVPFSSMVDLSKTRAGAFLTGAHSLRFLPSEFLLLNSRIEKPNRRFTGVGDPIYNLADPRSGPSKGKDKSASFGLARLAGSGREVQAAARESGLPETEILLGSQATVGGLQKALAKKPQILHFAVHVVDPEENDPGNTNEGSQAALALSLAGDSLPELLTTEAIAALRLPGSLVILSGCSSEKGEVLPGAGLMGLSRAWLLAGAAAVVVSAWPTPDDSGRFFSSFYGHFHAKPEGTIAERAALALQEAQIEMQHGDGYRKSPSFWAAYSVISKE